LPLERFEEAAALADLESPSSSASGFENEPGILDRIDQWLGTDDIFPGVHSLHDLRAVQGIRGIDGDDIDILARQQLLEIPGQEDIGMIGTGLGQFLLREIAPCDPAGVCGPAQTGEQGLPLVESHHPDTELPVRGCMEDGVFCGHLEIVHRRVRHVGKS